MASPFSSFDPPTVYAELQELPLVSTSVTTSTIRLMTIYLVNASDTDQTVTVTNTDGDVLVSQMTVPARAVGPALQFPFLYVVGLKWLASGMGINGQVEGYANA